MLTKFFAAAAAISLLLTPAPLSAQSGPWDTTDWVAICDLGEGQPISTRVLYNPEPDIYCTFEDYRFAEDPENPRRVIVPMTHAISALRAAEFASELYARWGLMQPSIDTGFRPAEVPPSPDFADEGMVLRLVPEISDDDGHGGTTVGTWSQRDVVGVDDAPGFLRVVLDAEAVDLVSVWESIAHEMFHAIRYAYVQRMGQPDAIWDENWIAEGLADTMAQTFLAYYNGAGTPLPAFGASDVPLTAHVRLSENRYTAYQGGLFTEDDDAVYDTSSFWSHLFATQLDDMRYVDAMMRAPETIDPGAPFIIDNWMDEDLGLSLPRAFRAFMRDVIRDGSIYDGRLEEQLLECEPYDVLLSRQNNQNLYQHVRMAGGDIRDRIHGMRIACFDYTIDATGGDVLVSLEPSYDGVDFSPHLQLFTADAVLNEGDTITIPAGGITNLRMVAFLNPLDRVAAAEDLIQRPFVVRFEQSSQSPCNTLGLALNEIANPWTAWDNGASAPNYIPEWGEAQITASFSGQTISGPACARLIVLDYGDPDGPALTFQLAHNTTNSYWGVPTGNWASINIHMPPGSFNASALASGRDLVFDQAIQIGDETAGFANSNTQFAIGPEHPFVSHFSTGPSPGGVGIYGHHLNESITLSFSDVGQRSATGTFTYGTFGPASASESWVIIQAEGSGSFTVPIKRMGPREDLTQWEFECTAALLGGRIWDAVMCARAHPDEWAGRNTLTMLDIYNSWFYYTFMQ